MKSQIKTCCREQAPWVEEGEKWSAYFGRLKKTRRETMTTLVDGVSVSHWLNKGMLETTATFYREMYTACPEDPKAMQRCLQKLIWAL